MLSRWKGQIAKGDGEREQEKEGEGGRESKIGGKKKVRERGS